MSYTIKNTFYDNVEKVSLCGLNDEYLKLIENHFEVNIINRGEDLIVMDDDKGNRVEYVIRTILKIIRSGYHVTNKDIVQILNLEQNNELDSFDKLQESMVGRTQEGKAIYPKSIGQLNYVNALKNYDIIFGVGPAGSGKTYLAVIYAVWLLKNHKIKKIILTRPAVEAGENLGFLPGDLKEKIDPYLRPLYDALYEMLGKENTEKFIERGIIEIAPLAYMRGRTLEDAFIILDEAQNTTTMQMKMFLTRLGFNSKMVITGDITQIDLRNNVKSGLKQVQEILNGIKEIKFIVMDSTDVCRHPLVQKIIDAYEIYEN
jgi:phosphate starvation-inducible PhoH-like protein